MRHHESQGLNWFSTVEDNQACHQGTGGEESRNRTKHHTLGLHRQAVKTYPESRELQERIRASSKHWDGPEECKLTIAGTPQVGHTYNKDKMRIDPKETQTVRSKARVKASPQTGQFWKVITRPDKEVMQVLRRSTSEMA